MSEWHPRARKRPLAYADQMPARKNVNTVCGHTNGGGSDLYSWFSRPGNNVASHFQVYWDGTFDQFIPRSRQAYAEVQGNDHCVSIECQDDGDPSRPLTAAQVRAFIDICEWLGTPAQVASETGPGVGWHELYASWNPHGHVCPGRVREAQIRTDIIPNLGGDDMPSVDDMKAAIREVLNEELVTVPGEAGEPAGAKRSLLTAVRVIWALGERLQPKKK